jgi:oligosaccharyltransferase complex subunit beta
VQELAHDGTWQPFTAQDIQLEFVMLDPLYIINLTRQNKSSAVYSAQYKVPDRLGVYKFMITYWRYGYTFLEDQLEVSVIQFRHDEFPRFIPVAFPYYATVFSIMGATFIFLTLFLYSEFAGPKKSEVKPARQ